MHDGISIWKSQAFLIHVCFAVAVAAAPNGHHIQMNAPGYEDKVPEVVQEANSKKKAEIEAQRDSVLKAMRQFEGLKI